jgi:hypothetical protein
VETFEMMEGLHFVTAVAGLSRSYTGKDGDSNYLYLLHCWHQTLDIC